MKYYPARPWEVKGVRGRVLICAGDVMAGFEHPVHGGISTARDQDPPTRRPTTSFCFSSQNSSRSRRHLLLLLLLQVADVPADSVDLYNRRRSSFSFFFLCRPFFVSRSRSMVKVASRRSLSRDEDVILEEFSDDYSLVTRVLLSCSD